MKGFMKKMFLLSGLFGLSWLFFAQSCMTFRKSDAEEKTEFAKSHVALRTGMLEEDGRQIHYAITGAGLLADYFFYSWISRKLECICRVYERQPAAEKIQDGFS